jgi:molybdopterin molybdotransferase
MLSVDQALQLVLEHAAVLPPHSTPLKLATGRVLAESILSDIDSPPHDKSVVDGYALIAADVAGSGVELTVLEEVTAGEVPTRPVVTGFATRIMTGAPIPAGADAVVMVEQTQLAGDRVVILQAPVKSGQNISRRASSLARGQAVLHPGKLLRPIEIGLLAEVGRSTVKIVPPPRVAILATGNELVSASAAPGPAQIRNSNGPLLIALARAAGAEATDLGIARDNESDLRRAIESGLAHDCLVLSGGVSAGVLDLVPKVFEQLGVDQVFHKVNLKPGKPLWFGVSTQARSASEGSGRQAGSSGETSTLVFGLPGNPVSSLVCFELFVRPAIQKLLGLPSVGLRRHTARLLQDHHQRGERPTYWPAAWKETDNMVTPLAWKGSGDLYTLTVANCLAYFPAGEQHYQAKQEIQILLFPEP